MAGKVSKPVNGVVKVNPGNTIAQIAKANNLTTKQVLDLNPALKSNPKYNNGNTIFSGTNVRVTPKEIKSQEKPKQAVVKEEVVKQEVVKAEEVVVYPAPVTTVFLTSSSTSEQAQIFNTPATPPVKTSTVQTSTTDMITFNEDMLPDQIMFDLIFEDIGGQELISISRSDIVNGQKIIYQPIKNLSSIQQEYNPNNILGLQQTSDKYFAGFSIKLEEKIPETGNGIDGKNAYIASNGDLVIEFINLNPDEQVEVKITLSGTIYE
jgi:hypothetical protein